MSTYLEYLQNMPEAKGTDCWLGKFLETEGREKHDEILDAIFQTGEDGKLYPISWLEAMFTDEYGWSEFFFRRHRNGKCVSCLNRTPKS